jgi:hypothetical protein
MKRKLISFFGMLSLVLMTSCASVGGVWDAGVEIVTGTVDAVVGGAATVARAVTDDVITVATVASDIGIGAVEAVSDEVDKQTDELQEEEEASEGK